MEEQLFAYLLCLRSTSFGLVATSIDDVMALFYVEDDEGIECGSRVGDGDVMERGGRAWRCSKKREGEHVPRAL